MNTQIIPMDRLAKIYLKIRTAKQKLTQDYEAELGGLESQESEIKNAMKAQLLALGAKTLTRTYPVTRD